MIIVPSQRWIINLYLFDLEKNVMMQLPWFGHILYGQRANAVDESQISRTN